MWRMNIGNGYIFERYGKALRVTRDDNNAFHRATTARICETALTSSVGTTLWYDSFQRARMSTHFARNIELCDGEE